jgi:2-polyprenyl-6-methoxyphenol hydroxylase-like FAD-dependent oxidoreductase
VLVIGGGIGGLTAGIALRRAGFDVELFERAPAIREVGAGISLWPNALHVLDEMGVGASVRRLGRSIGDGEVVTSSGRILIELSMAAIEAHCGAPVLMLHRASLIEALRMGFGEGFGERGLHLGHELAHVEQRGERVLATFTNGAVFEGDLLVAADGLRSAVRAQVFPAARAEYQGYAGLRAVIPCPPSVTKTREIWGRGARFGHIPLVDGRLYWFTSWNAPEAEVLTPDQRRQRALDTFRGWIAPVEELIRATEPSALLHDDVRELVGLHTWVDGRIVLLGDAAHAMTPNLGQGGCTSIEDAYVLARCLADESAVANALDRYVRLRRPRVASITRDSRQFGFFGQLESGLARGVRDAITIATKGSFGRGVVLKYAGTRPTELLEVTG